MKTFELYFNNKKKQESVFDSFVYEPENLEEKQMGSLHMTGELSRAMPQNADFLEELADIIKNAFYAKADLSGALRQANDFLDKEAKSGNVNWLGNLNFAVVSVKDSIINFTKVGNIKILLLRDGEVLDISQNLELQDQEPYPLKVFSNIASGKLLAQDKIFIATQEIFSVISKNDIIFNQLERVSKEKDLKNIFNQNRNVISESAGICLLIAEGNIASETLLPRMPHIALPKIANLKIILIVILTIVLTSGYFLFNDNKEKQPIKNQEGLQEARSKIMMAENFIILKKEEKAQALFQEAWDILSAINTKEAVSLREQIEEYLK